jgi:gliding motility-associated protein GldE
MDWLAKVLILFALLMCSAFFSGSEVALFSLNRKKLDSNFNRAGIIYRYLSNLINFPRRLLVTILIGNTLVNVAASIVAVSLALDFASHFRIPVDIAITFQILLITLLVLLFGELLPKVVASKNPVRFAKMIAVPLNICSIIIFPVSESLTELIRLASSKLNFDGSRSALTQDDLVELANISREKGTIEDDEHSLISSIVAFSSLMVGEVMTPRVDMIAVSIKDKYETLVKVINSSGHSRIPVYKEDIDEILGIIYAKDLLKFVKNPDLLNKFSLNNLIKKPLFIPPTKLITELLREFQEKKLHIAIVVDEYGGTAGLITLEDIIEEVVGDIWDEFDKQETNLIKIDKSKFAALGKIKLEELNEEIESNISLEDKDYDTLGGLVLNQAGSIPKEGFSFILGKYKYTVKEIQKKRIKKVIIEKTDSKHNN